MSKTLPVQKRVVRVGLRRKDVDLEKQILYVNQTLEHDGKTIKKEAKTKGSVRSITVSPSTNKVLLKHKEQQDSEKGFFHQKIMI
ncbi:MULTISPECIES: hypothetical protein [Bacillaceae]|uniref:Uncharacterized protein n=1 Tax=Domibacillus aminovorans TaxID=29332 RepID=A0A177KHR5_9BACI|nr:MULTISPECIES: hypothetical protein [Bacillaceae]OAH52930.1 hypothetical protein AWH48_14100 [Domibacillus aminovorans]